MSSPENKIIIKPDQIGGERILKRYSEAKQGRVFVIRLEDGKTVSALFPHDPNIIYSSQ